MTSTDAIDRFATLAQAYCHWCEAPAAAESDAGLLGREMRSLLARLIAAALELPESDCDDAPDAECVRSAELKALCPRLAGLALDFYGVYFLPSDLDSAVVGSLIDDLQDIYADLHAGLWLYERGHHAAAAWEWTLLFEVHWGHHAANALHALQAQAVGS